MLEKNLNCELVSNEDVSHLEGELKTLIDALGLSEKQEKAIKDQIQTILWDWYCFIRDHYLDHLQEKIDWYWENKIIKNPYYMRNCPRCNKSWIIHDCPTKNILVK